MTLLGLVGLKDPCRPSFSRAVENFRDSSFKIKIIIGDNIFTARPMVMECEILKLNDDLDNAIVKGVTFKNYTDEERMEKIEMNRVMAILSPFDKLLIVLSLK